MSLITQSGKTQNSEKQELIEAAKRRAKFDHENEAAEQLLRTTYEAEKARLRKGEPQASQEAKPSPVTKREPSPMQKQLDLERSMRTSLQAQAPPPQVPKPVPEPSPDTAQDDGKFAIKVIEVWKSSVQAKKDFPNLADFHDFCVECKEKEDKLRPHNKGIVGLSYYVKSINLEKGRERKS